MADMSIQERYDDISNLSGLSEEVVRRVLKACKTSLAKSLRQGSRATLPGICTMVPEVRNKLAVGGTSMTSYIKIKAKPSNAMDSELQNLNNFESKNSDENSSESGKLNFIDNDKDKAISNSGIRLKQINSLM